MRVYNHRLHCINLSTCKTTTPKSGRFLNTSSLTQALVSAPPSGMFYNDAATVYENKLSL